MWEAADGSLSGRNGRHPSSAARSMRCAARRRACSSMRSNPSDESIAIEDSSPMADTYDIVESSKRRASSARRSVSGSKSNGCWAPFQPTRSGNAGHQIRCERQQRHATVGRQPLVAARHHRVRTPPHGVHDPRTGELRRIHDDAGTDLVRPLRHPPGVDPRARRVLDHAEGHDRRRRIDRVDEILGEVAVGAVVDEPQRDPTTFGGREPRVRHARKVRSDEQDGPAARARAARSPGRVPRSRPRRRPPHRMRFRAPRRRPNGRHPGLPPPGRR